MRKMTLVGGMFVFVCAFLLAGASTSCAKAEPNKSKVEKEAPLFDGWEKLDIASRTAVKTRAPDESLKIIFKTDIPVKKKEKKLLKKAGVVVGAVINQIVTGSIRAGDMAGLAKLGFVVRIELAQKLGLK